MSKCDRVIFDIKRQTRQNLQSEDNKQSICVVQEYFFIQRQTKKFLVCFKVKVDIFLTKENNSKELTGILDFS